MISINECRGNAAALFLGLPLALAVCMSMSPSKSQEVQPFELSGHLPQLLNTPVQVMLDYDPSNSLNGTGVFNGATDADGAFKTNFVVMRGQAFVVLIDRTVYRLWCEPGANLHLETTDPAHPMVSGSVARANQFLFDQGLVQPRQEEASKPFDAAAHLARIDARSDLQLRHLRELSGAADLSERFALYAEAQIIGSATYRKNMHPRMLVRRGELAKDDIPEDYYAFLNSVPVLDDEAAFLSRSYQSALQAKFQHMAEQALIAEGSVPASDLGSWTRKELQLQGEQLARHPRTDELLFANKLNFTIQYLPAAETRGILGDFANRFPDSEYLSALREKFFQSLSIDLSSIDRAIEFRNTQGEPVEFSSLTGKVIYIDFWGLWCKACMTQRRDLERLVEEFAEEEIVFLALNFYDSEEDWAKFVAQHEGREKHWKPSGQAHEKRAKELFLLESFPRYMLFDRSGKLLSASAPTPGSDSIRQLLRDALRGPKDKR